MRGKHGKKIKSTKLFLMVISLTLVLCTIIGGTIAWLITKTDPVVNTFTYGDINIDLEETDTNKDGDDNPNTNDYPMVPGKPITKDPKVTVLANSEDAWLFVKLEKTANFDGFMEYNVILDDPATPDVVEGWTALEGVDGVYWMAVNKADKDAEFYVIEDNTVNVKGDVTKEELNALDANGADNYPRLTVTAYAVQRDAEIDDLDTAAKAWALIQTETTNS